MVTLIPVLFAIAGLLLYALGPGKSSEIGRIIFFCAFLVIMMRTGGGTVRLF